MGFVTAILLMYMSEEAAFWTLVALLKGVCLWAGRLTFHAGDMMEGVPLASVESAYQSTPKHTALHAGSWCARCILTQCDCTA